MTRRSLRSVSFIIRVVPASASTTVNAACCTHRFRTRLQTDIFRIESNGTVFSEITWNAHISNGLSFIERRIGIPEIEELFQVTHVCADVDYLEIRISCHLLLHVLAVRAGVHDEHLDHTDYFLYSSLVTIHAGYFVNDDHRFRKEIHRILFLNVKSVFCHGVYSLARQIYIFSTRLLAGQADLFRLSGGGSVETECTAAPRKSKNICFSLGLHVNSHISSSVMAFDFKKEYKEFYLPLVTPTIVDVPSANYIAVRGVGNPNDEDSEYKASIELLYGIAYTIKMSKKGDRQIEGYFDFVVPPLEGLWWSEKGEVNYAHKEDFHFISMIRLPDFVTKADASNACTLALMIWSPLPSAR